MLFLNKLLPTFVLPLGWVVILLLFGLLRKKRWPIVTALVLLFVSSMPFVSRDGVAGTVPATMLPVEFPLKDSLSSFRSVAVATADAGLFGTGSVV